jgi:DNA-binding transcriptional ArsR family regulator
MDTHQDIPRRKTDTHQDIPHRKTRIIIARLLHRILRLAHSAYIELPFMQAVEITVIVTAIFSAEHEGSPFSTLGLSQLLGMPRPTLLRRLSLLRSKGIIYRDTEGLRINPQLFMTPLRDDNIRLLRQIIIDFGIELSKLLDDE